MRTYFKKLNEQSNDFDWVDIADAISDNDLTKIIKGFPEYAKRFDTELKLFYKDNYKSPILDKLEREKIYIDDRHEFKYNDNIVKNIRDFKNIFFNSLFEYFMESIRNAIDYSKFKGVDDERLDDLINEYITENLIENITVYFLNKDKKSGDYILCMFHESHIYTMACYYSTTNNDNSFNIKDGDPVSKDHLIEYGKELCHTRKDGRLFYISMYSGYFDNL